MKGVGPGHKAIQKSSDFLIEVAKGKVPGHSIVHKYGHGVVGTTVSAITLSGFYRTPLAPVSLEFVSDDANDSALGTGAREIKVWGIDGNYDEIIQTIPTGGLGAVAIPIDLLRIHRWKVTASGTYANNGTGSHAGTLTIRVAGAGETWTVIDVAPYPQAQSEISCYTIRNGVTAYIVEHDVDVDSNKAVDVLIMAREGIDTVVAPFTPMQVKGHYVGMKGHAVTPFDAPQGGFPARTDLIYMGKVTSGSADVSVHFTLMLVEDGF